MRKESGQRSWGEKNSKTLALVGAAGLIGGAIGGRRSEFAKCLLAPSAILFVGAPFVKKHGEARRTRLSL